MAGGGEQRSLAQAVPDLDQAFGAWWGCLKGKGRGKVRAPRFKKRSNGQSMHLTRSAFRVEGYTLRLTKGVPSPSPGAGSCQLPAASGSVTLIKDCAGPYFASFVVEVERLQLEPNGKEVRLCTA